MNPDRARGQLLVLLGALAVVLAILLTARPAARITPQNAHRLREIGRLEDTLPDYLPIQFTLSPTGDALLATSGYTNYLWRLSDGSTRIMRLQDSGGSTVRTLFLDSTPVALFMNWWRTMSLLDMEDGKTLQMFENIAADQWGWNLSADGRWVVMTAEDVLTVVNTRSGETRFTIPAPADYSFRYSIPTFNADASLVATAIRDRDGGGDDTITLWDAFKGEQVATLGAFPKGIVWAFDFSDDGSLLAIGGGVEVGNGGIVELWNLETSEKLGFFEGGGLVIYSILISPDNRRIAAEGLNDVWLWDIEDALATGNMRLHLEGDGNSQHYSGIAFSPDGSLFATGDPLGNVLVMDAASGELLATLPGHQRNIGQIAFSPDGRRLITGGSDGMIRLWSLGASVPSAIITQMSLPAPVVTPTVTPTTPPVMPTLAGG